jgi:hypothetical protein
LPAAGLEANNASWGDRYPPFMDRNSGQLAQKQLWRETKEVFERAVPEVSAVYRMLDKEGE